MTLSLQTLYPTNKLTQHAKTFQRQLKLQQRNVLKIAKYSKKGSTFFKRFKDELWTVLLKEPGRTAQ
jgi:hypothetical protein